MPEFEIGCRNCKFRQDLLLTSAKHYERVVSMLPCEACGKCDWVKIPTTANLKPDGTYSWREK